MFKLPQARVVTFDVDDTMLMWEPEKYEHTPEELLCFTDEYGQWHLLPHVNHVMFMRKLKQQGYGIVLWSAAGTDWAEKAAEMLKIEDLVDVCMSKPEFAVDDLLEAKRIIKSVIWLDPVTGDFKRSE